jgi:hypothetical protein
MSTKTITPVVDNATATKQDAVERTFVNNIPDNLSALDTELAYGYQLQTVYTNETDYRLFALVQGTINYNKQVARAAVADYERAVDAFAKLPQNRKSLTHDAAEALYITTDIGKIKLAIKQMCEQYLIEHK